MNQPLYEIGDIDIDCANRNDILNHIQYISAKKTDGTKHNSGVYVQDIDFDPVTMLSKTNYKEEECSKFDFLNLTILNKFKSIHELDEYVNKEPNWNLLQNKEVVSFLPQIYDHYDLICERKPKSVDDLVWILNKIREHVKYHFKKSHATAYALTIVCLLNLIQDKGIDYLKAN